jgi:hypothetical protein
MFEVTHRDGAARRGRLTTPHGDVETPVFMPVGTQGTVKAMTPRDLEDVGASIILGNTYHLYLRPGDDLIARRGGLHRFMGWSRPLLTDSGGYQVFSLAARRTIDEAGVRFRSHLDGAPYQLTPEKAVDIQAQLGSDIAMVLDECPALPSTEDVLRASVELTARWASRCRRRWIDLRDGAIEGVTISNKGQLQFGIVQGGTSPSLRQLSVERTLAVGFDGYALGRAERGREPGRHVSHRGQYGAVAAGPPASLPHGGWHADRPGGMRGARDRHVRLRPPDEKRAQRPAVYQRGPAQHQKRPVCGGRFSRRPGLPVLHLPALLAGVSAAPVRRRRDHRKCP